MCREYWLLDVYERLGKLVLRLYSEDDGRLYEREARIPFYGYLIGDDPERVVFELKESELVDDAWVEVWFTPPLYRESTKVVVFKVYGLEVLKRIVRKGCAKGLRHVNSFPNPITEALFNAGLQPLTKLAVDKDVFKPLRWSPTELDPPLNVARIHLENCSYVLYEGDSVEAFRDLRDLAKHLISRKYHLGVTDKEIYVRLLEEEPKVSSSASIWVTGGSYSIAEYFEWCRYSYTPLSLMGNVTIGKVITTMEALEARKRKYLIDRYTRRVEGFRSMADLLLYDRGGVIYRPKSGLYWNVCQVDFKSLYPNIIVKFNISGETVNLPTCINSLRPEWTHHTICMDVDGVVPASISKLIKLKSLYEELYDMTGLRIYNERRSACKWVLVASFGYLGYRNSLFGSVMAHEVVTSTGRHLMTVARKAVESMGYRVIHALVDSLFIEGITAADECGKIREVVSRATGFETKVESHYTWLYIPTSVDGSHGVANRYYGKLSSGGVKLKGITCVRRDTPAIIKEAQMSAISELAKANTKVEMPDAIVRAHTVLERYRRKLVDRDYELSDMLVMRGGGGRRNGYVKPPEYVLSDGPPYILYITRNGYIKRADQSVKLDINLSYYLSLLDKAAAELPSTQC